MSLVALGLTVGSPATRGLADRQEKQDDFPAPGGDNGNRHDCCFWVLWGNVIVGEPSSALRKTRTYPGTCCIGGLQKKAERLQSSVLSVLREAGHPESSGKLSRALSRGSLASKLYPAWA